MGAITAIDPGLMHNHLPNPARNLGEGRGLDFRGEALLRALVSSLSPGAMVVSPMLAVMLLARPPPAASPKSSRVSKYGLRVSDTTDRLLVSAVPLRKHRVSEYRGMANRAHQRNGRQPRATSMLGQHPASCRAAHARAGSNAPPCALGTVRASISSTE